MRHSPRAARSLLFVLAALLQACAHPPGYVAPKAPDLSAYDELVVVGTNDFHGYLRPVETPVAGAQVLAGGAEWFGGYVDVLHRKFGDRLILLDAGDIYQGTLDSNASQGESVVEYYNRLPYRALAVGNHEFDYGPEKGKGRDPLGALKARMRQSAHPFVQANIFHRRTGALWRERNLFPSVVVRAGDYKVGIIGLTTTSTPGKTLPAHVRPFEFRDFTAPALAEARRLRADGADLVLVTTHEGEGRPGDPIFRFLHALPPGTVDAVVSGHSHTEVHELVHGVPVIQSRTRGAYFGRIDLFVSKATRRLEPSLTRIHAMHPICGTWFRRREGCDAKAASAELAAGRVSPEDLVPLRPAVYEGEEVRPSLEVRKAIAPYLAAVDSRRREVLGRAGADFEWYPSGENQMGTLLLDAFHDRFPQAAVIVLNGGGIRRRISKGPVTFGDLYEMSPFDNRVVLLRMTGRQLKELLKAMTSGTHMVPAVKGVEVHYFNRRDPAFDRDVNGDGKKEAWERDRLDPRRGVSWEGSGKPVGDQETFWVATIDYLAAGGDNTSHVFQQVPESRRRYFPATPHDLLTEYLRKHPGIALPRTDVMRVHGIQGPGAADPPRRH